MPGSRRPSRFWKRGPFGHETRFAAKVGLEIHVRDSVLMHEITQFHKRPLLARLRELLPGEKIGELRVRNSPGEFRPSPGKGGPGEHPGFDRKKSIKTDPKKPADLSPNSASAIEDEEMSETVNEPDNDLINQPSDYDSGNVQILRDADHIRRRPVSTLATREPMVCTTLVYELVYNSVDEALAGHCKHIHVKIDVDGSCTVRDDGRASPLTSTPRRTSRRSKWS